MMFLKIIGVILLGVALWSLIGYWWWLRMSYKEGAGFKMPFKGLGLWNTVRNEEIHMWLWPVSVAHWYGAKVKRMMPNKALTPKEMYEKGLEDNDIDKQAEKHLL